MEPFTIITPTGDRPEAFALCCKYISRQTIPPSQWIVVDDGEKETSLPSLTSLSIDYIRRTKQPSDPVHTLSVQMLAALSAVKTKYVLIMEDDDWYSPSYAEIMMSVFVTHKSVQLAGQAETIYYHIPSCKYFQNPNKNHASWCQTAFRSDFIPFIQNECKNLKGNPFLDIHVWGLKARKFILPGDKPLCIGIKGMPGRQGTTSGWNENHPRYKQDQSFSVLKEYIGNDVQPYEKIRER